MMKIPSFRMVSAMALSSLQARDPIVFENSFQTLTASSLSWIDKEILTQATNIFLQNDIQKENMSGTTENENEKHHCHHVVAEALIRRIVFKILDKYNDISSPERVEEALKYHNLPERLKHELVIKYGGSPPATWFDALEQLQDFCSDESIAYDRNNADRIKCNSFDKETLWKQVLKHPITSYVPVQCQSCGGHIVPDDNPHSSRRDDADLGLNEESPLPEEAPLVRTGWFRGPRPIPSVFVLNCPKCKAQSRWFRSRDPQIILNPQRWGRLCGEQEDLRLDLANYFGFVSIRSIVPLDWDHIWSEFRIIDEDGEDCCDEDSRDFEKWRLKDDDRNFAARLDEGIGSWTAVFAVSPNPDLCRDLTNSYLSCESTGGCADNHFMGEMKRYRRRITETRTDHSGAMTQAGTVNGYAVQRAKLTSSKITSIIQRAAKEYGSRTWYQV